MGIPSYYKRLLDRLPALVTKAHPGAIDWLWMDFNCLMYHCLRDPELRPFPGTGAGTAYAWEGELLDRILTYTERVVREVGPKEGVYIAVDGVVPMAKMRQQRLRRFKSSWLAEAGLAEGQVAGVARWDTNALTPGTAFMGRLRRLFEETIARRRLPWTFSSSDEPGEGEHKIMAQWRNGDRRGSRYTEPPPSGRATSASRDSCPERFAVYGLDADLVVLSLLTQDTLHRAGQPVEVWLFREQIEEGAMVRNEKGETQFHWFDVNLLRGQLRIELRGDTAVSLQDYCFAMSFLGNDFLPPSLSLKMREDGHEQLMEALRRLRAPLVDLDKAGRPICVEGLQALLRGFADAEEGRVWKTIDRKRFVASRVTEETGLGQTNWALVQGAEDCLLDLGSTRPKPPLSASWRSTYSSKLLGAEPRVAVQKYLEGVQWIWNYYKGEEVCFNWVYPWTLPPLWSDFQASASASATATATATATIPFCLPPVPPIVLRSADIRTAEQLCLVLPPASGHLLPGDLHRRFVAAAPWLFPVSFGFGSVGKRWFWECEPEIPVPTLTEVKAVLAKLR